MSTVRVTHIGGPTALIEVDGWRILTDPTFDSPGRKYHFGWGTGSRKVTGPAIAVADLGPIDAVLLTHDHHADNLDDAGRELLPSAGVVVTTTAGAKRLGTHARGLEPWASTRLEEPARPSIEITATPCRHGPPLSRPLAGDVVGFALRWDGQEHGVLWISGDTVLYDGVRHIADRFHVGVALLHLGGARFPVTGPVRYTMTARTPSTSAASFAPAPPSRSTTKDGRISDKDDKPSSRTSPTLPPTSGGASKSCPSALGSTSLSDKSSGRAARAARSSASPVSRSRTGTTRGASRPGPPAAHRSDRRSPPGTR